MPNRVKGEKGPYINGITYNRGAWSKSIPMSEWKKRGVTFANPFSSSVRYLRA